MKAIEKSFTKVKTHEQSTDVLDAAADQDFNVLSYHRRDPEADSGRIDIWWRLDAGNIAFSLALLVGAAVMADTLKETWQRKPRVIPIGINLCKSKIASLEK